jgi:hypothetical protein
MRSQL